MFKLLRVKLNRENDLNKYFKAVRLFEIWNVQHAVSERRRVSNNLQRFITNKA